MDVRLALCMPCMATRSALTRAILKRPACAASVAACTLGMASVRPIWLQPQSSICTFSAQLQERQLWLQHA
jgi:hypothetical protein